MYVKSKRGEQDSRPGYIYILLVIEMVNFLLLSVPCAGRGGGQERSGSRFLDKNSVHLILAKWRCEPEGFVVATPPG